MNQKEFALQIGKSASYVSLLKKSGRLIMIDARHINVDASLKRIAETATPSHIGLAEHHQRKRVQKQEETMTGLAIKNEVTDLPDTIIPSYHDARAIRETYLALQEKRNYQKAIGLLRDAKEVEFIAQDAATIFRNRIESMFHSLAPILADEKDEQRILHLLFDEWELICRDLERRLNQMATSS